MEANGCEEVYTVQNLISKPTTEPGFSNANEIIQNASLIFLFVHIVGEKQHNLPDMDSLDLIKKSKTSVVIQQAVSSCLQVNIQLLTVPILDFKKISQGYY